MLGTHHIPEGSDGKKDFSEIIARASLCKPPVEIEHGHISVEKGIRTLIG